MSHGIPYYTIIQQKEYRKYSSSSGDQNVLLNRAISDSPVPGYEPASSSVIQIMCAEDSPSSIKEMSNDSSHTISNI